ncbi:MAG: type III-A CRISPR-associated RAMP protein Csm3 [Anaerolineae bacterium]
MCADQINLYGRVIIRGNIRAITGLHIGRGKEGVMIGGVDNPVMRDPLTNQPYIPGSSLKGKLRSLAEKRDPNAQPNYNIGTSKAKVRIHACSDPNCKVCPIYGIPGQEGAHAPTRLVIRDAFLTPASINRLSGFSLDQPFTEVKYEASIDRITSAANPRPLERVPADSVFGPFEMIFSIYDSGDFDLLPKLFEAMRLLEDDYLGGSGSRGSGKVKFEGLSVEIKPVEAYSGEEQKLESFSVDDTAKLRGLEAKIIAKAREVIPLS